MENEMKLVEFDRFCKDCKWSKEIENGEHCDECLSVPARECSHTPEKYEKR